MLNTGWRTRGYLPHRDEARLVQHVVFNLADAIPYKPAQTLSSARRLEWADSTLDAGHGSRLLLNHDNALVVENCILRDHGVRYALAAWCVMPNHVHVVVEQFRDISLSAIVQTWKSVSAHAINARERRSGPLWQREYFDRFMRTEEQLVHALDYVENNPVAARLAMHPGEWRFSSAWAGRNQNAGEGAGAPSI